MAWAVDKRCGCQVYERAPDRLEHSDLVAAAAPVRCVSAEHFQGATDRTCGEMTGCDRQDEITGFFHGRHRVHIDRRAPRLPDQVSGSVHLAIADTISGYPLPWLISAMRRELPAVRLELEERNRDEIEVGLRRRGHDMAIVLVSNLSRARDIGRETLVRSRRQLWTAMQHPLAAKPRVPLADVAACDYVLLDMDEHVETVREYWSRHRLQPKTGFSSKSIEAVRSLVAQNVGVTILSDRVYRPWSHDGGRIQRKPLADAVPSMDLGLAFLRGETLSPAAQALRKLIRRSAKALSGDGMQAQMPD